MNRSFTATIAVFVLLLGAAPLGRGMEMLRPYLPTQAEPSPTPTATTVEEAAPPEAATETKDATLPPIVRVNVASQSFNFAQPWRKNSQVLRQGLGVVLMDGRILVTAELVNNHTYVELEKPENASANVTA